MQQYTWHLHACDLPATLARAGRDLGIQAASVELGLDLLGQHTGSLTLLLLALNMVGAWEPLDLTGLTGLRNNP